MVFSVGIVSDAIFAAPVPEKEGFIDRGGRTEAGGGGEAAPAEEPIAVLLATADPEAGEAVFKKCVGLPHRGEGRRQQGRPESLGHRQPPDRLA